MGSKKLPLGMARLGTGAVEEAVKTLEQATQRSPENRLAWMALISALGTHGQAGKAKDAMSALDELLRRDKHVSFTVAKARENWPFETAADREKFFDGLRDAGVPEG